MGDHMLTKEERAELETLRHEQSYSTRQRLTNRIMRELSIVTLGSFAVLFIVVGAFNACSSPPPAVPPPVCDICPVCPAPPPVAFCPTPVNPSKDTCAHYDYNHDGTIGGPDFTINQAFNDCLGEPGVPFP